MSTQEALEIVDIVVEALRERRILPEQNYGMMTEDQRHALADLSRSTATNEIVTTAKQGQL